MRDRVSDWKASDFIFKFLSSFFLVFLFSFSFPNKNYIPIVSRVVDSETLQSPFFQTIQPHFRA